MPPLDQLKSESAGNEVPGAMPTTQETVAADSSASLPATITSVADLSATEHTNVSNGDGDAIAGANDSTTEGQDATGDPVLQTAPRKRGRPRKNPETAARLNSVTPAPARPAIASTAPIVKIDSTQAAKLAANMWFNVGELALGEEWRPNPDEPQMVFVAFKDYFESAGISTIPPSWQLALTLVTYTAARVNKPTIKTRLFGAMEWVKTKLRFKR